MKEGVQELASCKAIRNDPSPDDTERERERDSARTCVYVTDLMPRGHFFQRMPCLITLLSEDMTDSFPREGC